MYGYYHRPNPGPRLAMGLGLTFGALSGLVTVLAIQHMRLVTLGYLSLGLLGLYVLSFLIVGFLSTRVTGEVKSGARAGLLTGMYYSLTSGTITVVIITIAPDIYIHSLYPTYLASLINARVAMLGAFVNLVCLVPFWMVAGYALGAFGGVIGSYFYRERAITNVDDHDYGQPSAAPMPSSHPYAPPPAYPMYAAPQEQAGYQPRYFPDPETYEPPRYVPGGGDYSVPPDNPDDPNQRPH
jgi:hypothetical protein